MDILISEIRALVASGHGETRYIADLFGVSIGQARRLLAEARGRCDYCARCGAYMSHDGALSWCPACAWEPPESAVHVALIPHEEEPTPPTPAHCPICNVECWPGGPLRAHIISHSVAHGTLTSYNHGCRCAPCKQAMTLYQRQRRRRLSA